MSILHSRTDTLSVLKSRTDTLSVLKSRTNTLSVLNTCKLRLKVGTDFFDHLKRGDRKSPWQQTSD